VDDTVYDNLALAPVDVVGVNSSSAMEITKGPLVRSVPWTPRYEEDRQPS